ncbi:MAG: mechanosensitive ion channel family protein, partial [Nanoarchaeota archaeon]
VKRRFEVGTSVFDKPIIRLSLADSWINLRVRYLIDVRKKKGVNTKLNSIVLEKFGNTKDIKLAYPHMHVILDK